MDLAVILTISLEPLNYLCSALCFFVFQSFSLAVIVCRSVANWVIRDFAHCSSVGAELYNILWCKLIFICSTPIWKADSINTDSKQLVCIYPLCVRQHSVTTPAIYQFWYSLWSPPQQNINFDNPQKITSNMQTKFKWYLPFVEGEQMMMPLLTSESP